MFKACRHIMPSGARCHSPALHDKSFCYFHNNLRQSAAPNTPHLKPRPLEIPPIEDQSSILLALTQVLSQLATGSIDPRRAGLLLYGLQIAAQVIDVRKPAVEPNDLVRIVSPDAGDPSLAPEEEVCEPQDCDQCAKRRACNKPQRNALINLEKEWEEDKKWFAEMARAARQEHDNSWEDGLNPPPRSDLAANLLSAPLVPVPSP